MAAAPVPPMGMFGSPQPKPNPQAEPEPEPEESPELDEQQRLVAWEFLCFLDLGFTIDQAQLLICVPHISWHDADALLKKGCSRSFVVDQLT